jgi:hypothetical protein
MNKSDLRMKRFHRLRFFLAVLLLFACITPYVSAFTVSSTNVDPRGSQAPGTPMTVNAVIDFSQGGTETFPSESELQMRTNLDDPVWVPVLVVDGVETHLLEKTGESLIIQGWYLAYPSRQNVQLRVTVTGNMPANPSPNLNFLKIREVDSSDNVVLTARVEMPEAPVITLSTLSTPTKKSATKKIFTPIPIDTPTQESPLGTGAGIIAITGAALLVIRRR